MINASLETLEKVVGLANDINYRIEDSCDEVHQVSKIVAEIDGFVLEYYLDRGKVQVVTIE